jgi:hypothetical protein
VEKQKATLFAGAILADQGTTDPKLNKLTAAYHLATEANLRQMVEQAEKSNGLQSGVPYMFGAHPVSERNLSGLPADAVIKNFRVGTSDYKMVWVGSTAVIVKPGETAPPNPSKTGIKALYLHPEVEKNLLLGGSHPANILRTLPVQP